MKAKHGLTKSERKQHRIMLHQTHEQNVKSQVREIMHQNVILYNINFIYDTGFSAC